MVAPSDAQLLDCLRVAPPETDYYLTLTQDAREKILMDNIRAHLLQQKICNARWKKLREWKADQLKLLQQK